MDKQVVVAEIQRVASLLQTPSLTYRQFGQNSKISPSAVESAFGSWNQAIEAAGLIPNPKGPQPHPLIPDEVLLQEIIRLTQQIGKRPSSNEMNAKGHFSSETYRTRWGSLKAACEVAYAQYGFPEIGEEVKQVYTIRQNRPTPTTHPIIIPETHRPKQAEGRKKAQFGEPIDFRGLRHAPINEQGVVYIFGMLSRELGFLIEAIRTSYPDCEGKRCISPDQQRWEHVLIEFEYRSKNFLEHHHDPANCDLIVCWIHDWEDCPVEVLELRSQIKHLSNQ